MSVLSNNMRHLRAQFNASQQKIADQLGITRGRYAKYEEGASEPPVVILIRISAFFGVSIDLLVSVDIGRYPVKNLVNLPDNRVLLPVVVDEEQNNKIELIPQKASMGYLKGYADPGYIEGLQTLSLPFLNHGKYRAFPADGDSMPPFRDGTFIVGRYVEEFSSLKVNRTYIFITRNDGITYKRLSAVSDEHITVSADNNFYEPYDISLSDLVEVWQFACSISSVEFEPEDFSNQNVRDMFSDIKKELHHIGRSIDRMQPKRPVAQPENIN